MKYKAIAILVVCTLFMVNCGRNEKAIVTDVLKLRIEYLKSDKYINAKDTDDLAQAFKEIEVNYLGPKGIGELEFAEMQDKYSNDAEVAALVREFQQAFNDAFAKKIKKAWGKK